MQNDVVALSQCVEAMMKSELKKAAAAAIAPQVMRRFKWRYLLYGVAAYYALKLLSKKGVLPKQADKALDLIDQGIDMAKESVGIPHQVWESHPADREPKSIH